MRSVRRTLGIATAAAGLVAGTALPASAAPLNCNVYAGNSNLTTATVCVDVTGSNRAVYVQGTSTIPVAGVLVEVENATLIQCSATTGCSNAVVDPYNFEFGTGTAIYVGPSFAVQFGHTYQSCAKVTITLFEQVTGTILAVDSYPTLCSGIRTN